MGNAVRVPRFGLAKSRPAALDRSRWQLYTCRTHPGVAAGIWGACRFWGLSARRRRWSAAQRTGASPSRNRPCGTSRVPRGELGILGAPKNAAYASAGGRWCRATIRRSRGTSRCSGAPAGGGACLAAGASSSQSGSVFADLGSLPALPRTRILNSACGLTYGSVRGRPATGVPPTATTHGCSGPAMTLRYRNNSGANSAR